MEFKTEQEIESKAPRRIKDLINTPFKKAMFVVQLISYVLIPGSPVIGGIIGTGLNLKTGQTAGLVLGIFIVGEVLFYGSLFFLGKEIVLLVKEKMVKVFRKKKKYDI